jgi:S-adenosylmethionine:tRNA ribosyltransferase-isomerase
VMPCVVYKGVNDGELVMTTQGSSDYDYGLPEELIAFYPADHREQSRMLLVNRQTGEISHHQFFEVLDLLPKNALLVLNDTRVLPARLRFTDRNAEILLLQQMSAEMWKCLVRPGRWFAAGRKFVVHGVHGRVIEVLPDGERLIQFDGPLDLERLGELPLPPYIDRQFEPLDRDRYQTVYANKPGAIAAPTAGLHFTPEILKRIPHEFVTLHVGIGTFRPVKVETIAEHKMHWEEFEVSPSAASRINEATSVVAVGTTTVRTLETLMKRHGRIIEGTSGTDLFIYPPFHFRKVNALLTNFHLPKSTLLMLVSAFGGKDLMMEAYRKAVEERYRFFSYGDCMLIL